MPIGFKIPVNCKIAFPTTLPAGLLEPILRPLRRGPKTAGSVLHDLVALRKSLMLCKSCEVKMHPAHLKRLGYVELTQFHARGLCDGCQHETHCALWLPHDSPHVMQDEERRSRAALRQRDQQARTRFRH